MKAFDCFRLFMRFFMIRICSSGKSRIHFRRSAARDRHRHHGSAAVSRRDRQAPAAHDCKPLPDVLQGDMRLAVIGGDIAAAVVRYGDLASGGRYPGPYGNVQRACAGVSAVLDGVFHNGLQGQRRQAICFSYYFPSRIFGMLPGTEMNNTPCQTVRGTFLGKLLQICRNYGILLR